MILPSILALEDPRIRTKDLLRHTMEAPHSGLLGIDLHLGQNTKLGGRYTDISLIYISNSVGTLYIHVSLSFVFVLSLFYFGFPKTQKAQKYFCCFSLFVSLAFKFLFALFSSYGFLFKTKIQKDFALFAVSKSKTQKYLLFFFGFVKFAAEVNSYP